MGFAGGGGSVLPASGVPTKEYTWQGTLLKPRIEFDGTKRTLATWLPTASCLKRRSRSSSGSSGPRNGDCLGRGALSQPRHNKARPHSSCGDHMARTPRTRGDGVRSKQTADSVLLPGTKEVIHYGQKKPTRLQI